MENQMSLSLGALGFKFCSGCRIEKSLSEYYLNRGRSDGVQVYCKECFRHPEQRIPREPKQTETHKRCPKCERWKEKSEFHVSRYHGVVSYCRSCENKTDRRFLPFDATEKRCTQCKLVKSLDAFHHRSRRDGTHGYQPKCKACRSAYSREKGYYLKRDYNLSIEDYRTMLESQDYVCAICGLSCRTQQNLVVDHDHKTGQVRGLLCRGCNSMLGYIMDDVTTLKNAIAYLEKHRPKGG